MARGDDPRAATARTQRPSAVAVRRRDARAGCRRRCCCCKGGHADTAAARPPHQQQRIRACWRSRRRTSARASRASRPTSTRTQGTPSLRSSPRSSAAAAAAVATVRTITSACSRRAQAALPIVCVGRERDEGRCRGCLWLGGAVHANAPCRSEVVSIKSRWLQARWIPVTTGSTSGPDLSRHQPGPRWICV